MREKKNSVRRSLEEKEKIVLESFEKGIKVTAEKYDIYPRLLKKWRSKYHNYGLEGLVDKTGKGNHRGCGNHYVRLERKKNKTREEELELENLKLKVEVARLKKGYQVKGVGSKKEYVTIKDLNTKS